MSDPLTTAAAVAESTGVTVTADQLAQATAIVETYVGRDLDLPDRPGPLPYAARDRRLLAQGIAWQAVYLAANPDTATRAGGLVSASTNGNSFTLDTSRDGEVAALVAPLARLALRRLSWRRSRTVPVAPPLRAVGRYAQTLTNDGLDRDWRAER